MGDEKLNWLKLRGQQTMTGKLARNTLKYHMHTSRGCFFPVQKPKKSHTAIIDRTRGNFRLASPSPHHQRCTLPAAVIVRVTYHALTLSDACMYTSEVRTFSPAITALVCSQKEGSCVFLDCHANCIVLSMQNSAGALIARWPRGQGWMSAWGLVLWLSWALLHVMLGTGTWQTFCSVMPDSNDRPVINV